MQKGFRNTGADSIHLSPMDHPAARMHVCPLGFSKYRNEDDETNAFQLDNGDLKSYLFPSTFDIRPKSYCLQCCC